MNERMIGRGHAVPFVSHGGPDVEELRRLGLSPAEVLDFSTCINPFGPSPLVAEAVVRMPIDQYPDPNHYVLRSALAALHGLDPGQVVIGNGVSELIALVALAFVRPGDLVAVMGPTYGEYGRAALLHGGQVVSIIAREEDGFVLNLDRLDVSECRLVFLCNPNNPTGQVYDPESILALARKNPRKLIVVDEAYQGLAPGLESLSTRGRAFRRLKPAATRERFENLLVLRSMTKDHALAGLRIGYAVGPEGIIGELAKVQPPWSVNALAQAAAVAALEDRDHLAKSLAKVAEAKNALVRGLQELGFALVSSAANFFLMHVGAGREFRQALLARGILVRDAASFGLPAYVRLAPRRPIENERLLAVLCQVAW
jgi:histidinol-phosphate aminotransferase